MLYQKISNTIGTITNSILNRVVSPIERLEYHLECKQNELREVMENITKLRSEIRKLHSTNGAALMDIKEAELAAKEALKAGNEALAMECLQRKVALEQSVEKTSKFISELELKEQQLKNQTLKFESAINDIKAEINILKTEDNIASVKLKVAEHTSSLNDDSFEIGKQSERARDEITGKTARADAILELQEEGAYQVLSGEDKTKKAIKATAVSAKASAELERIKEEMKQQVAQEE